MTDHQFHAYLRLFLSAVQSAQAEPGLLEKLADSLRETLAEPCAPETEADGMTNAQFRGFLLDEQSHWREMLALCRADGAENAAAKAERRLDTIAKQLEIL